MVNFIELIDKFIAEKKRCIINGMPSDDNTRGLILQRHEDFVKFEMLNVKVEKRTNREKQTREIVYIPLLGITDISEGEAATEISALEKATAEKRD